MPFALLHIAKGSHVADYLRDLATIDDAYAAGIVSARHSGTPPAIYETLDRAFWLVANEADIRRRILAGALSS